MAILSVYYDLPEATALGLSNGTLVRAGGDYPR